MNKVIMNEEVLLGTLVGWGFECSKGIPTRFNIKESAINHLRLKKVMNVYVQAFELFTDEHNPDGVIERQAVEKIVGEVHDPAFRVRGIWVKGVPQQSSVNTIAEQEKDLVYTRGY